MADGMVEIISEARQRAHRAAFEVPIEQVNPARAAAFRDDAWHAFFERLRRDDPVHYTADSNYGPFWSITKYHDIIAVDSNHGVFSSASGIGLAARRGGRFEPPPPSDTPRQVANNFISMDPPKHDVQRKTVSPAVAPTALATMAPIIRERCGLILDSLPIGEPFNWVDLVSKELTTMTLATLFDFPFEDRRKLTFWSDAMTQPVGYGGVVDTPEARAKALDECFGFFSELWEQRVNAPPAGDLISCWPTASTPATCRQRSTTPTSTC